MNLKKILALILALAMILTVPFALAEDADWTAADYAAHADYRTSLEKSYEGKTVILHSNDVHGQIDGYAMIAGVRNYFESLGADVILADAGDFSQGTIYVSTSKGESAVELMNYAKYDVAVLGNHEFDYGLEALTENVKKAEFPILCANVTVDATGETLLPGTTVLTTKSGLKIGFVGIVTPETVTKVNPGMLKTITFSTFDKVYEATQKAIDAVRGESDLVIGLFHLGVDIESKANGYRSTDMLKKVTGIDFVLDGHSHTEMTAGQNGEPIQSTGTKFATIGVVVIDNETKKVEANYLIPTNIDSTFYTFRMVDPEAALGIAAIQALVDQVYSEVFATSDVVLNGEKAPGNRTEETNLGDLFTDAMVWSVVKEGGIEQVEPNAVVGITNGGGIRASIGIGDVTKKDISTTHPFGNTVGVVYVTGAELLEVLEASTYCTPDPIGGFPQTSGIEWTLDTTKAYDKGSVYVLNDKESSYFAPASIQRVTITAINGQPFDLKATYAVVTNNFCADGGDTYNVFAKSESRFDTGIPLDQAVMAYVADVLNGKITKEAYGAPQGRLTIIQ